MLANPQNTTSQQLVQLGSLVTARLFPSIVLCWCKYNLTEIDAYRLP